MTLFKNILFVAGALWKFANKMKQTQAPRNYRGVVYNLEKQAKPCFILHRLH